jgi:hypothetical protein
MQNEFEKQVQQKMEELKLVPSEPVWQRVEMQIQKKKDRRRLILWILLPVLLGGLSIGIEQYSNNIAYNKNNVEKINPPLQKQNSLVQKEQSISGQTIIESQERNLNSPSIVQPGEINPITTSINEHISNTVPPQKKLTQAKEPQKERSIIAPDKRSSIINDDTILAESSINPDKIGDSINESQPTDQPLNLPDSSLINTQPNKKIDSCVKDENKVEASVPKTDSVNNHTLFQKKLPTKKYAASKWKTAFTVSTGISGAGRLDAFSGLFGDVQKSLQSSPTYSSGAPGGGNQLYYGSSDVTNGFSFATGAVAKKQIGKRKSFSMGLQYNYYSNSIVVGNRVTQNTIVRDYAVSQYYLNSTNGNGITTSQPYTNSYHFVSIPIAIDWQLVKKHPLNFYTGLSFQYLLQTNGLVFDYSRQAYFHNIKAFNRTQLFSGIGLNYSFSLKKSLIRIGPELYYGLTSLEKANSESHLFMYSLKAQLQLNKK